MDIEAFILAGGRSSRMGENKALLPFNGKSMFEHTIALAQEVSQSVCVVGDPNEYSNFDVDCVSDIIQNIGPIGGIYTALKTSKAEHVLILSVDSPMLSKELLNRLFHPEWKTTDISYFQHKSQQYPLTAIYSKSSLREIEQQIETGNFKVRDCFDKLRVKAIELTVDEVVQLANINTKEDLRRYEGIS